MEGEVVLVARQLATAVELAMGNSVPQQQRLEAYNACENFKEKSPLCVQCGLYLAQKPEFSLVVRHFGLQLMEHCIKYRWYNLTQPEKLFIKENAMKLVEGGLDVQSVDQAHIKDALSRVIVEMIKREWPQQWPTLLTELSQACGKGCTQTELVLLVFLRLAEDVAILQTLESNQRRKDLYQALTTNMADIFTFFLKLIEEHYQKHMFSLEQGLVVETAAHAKVVQVVLLTLSGFVEWVAMTHIMADEGKMLQILCLLLKNETFQTPAAECLLQIVSRKGKMEERRPLLILFSADAMACMFHAAGVASEKALDEKHYMFLKILTQVLTGIGTQLCSLWGKDVCGNRPPNFSMYLEAISTFSRHPSLTVSHYANALWTAFFKHELISKDSVFLSFVPKWVEATAPKIMKVVFPTVKCVTSPTDSAPYAVLDYDSEEEFNIFFHRCRTDMLDTFKQATLVAPSVTFSYMQEWLSVRIQKTLSIPEPLCTVQSPSYIEWEALSLVLDSVLSRIVMCAERPALSAGPHLLDPCQGLESQAHSRMVLDSVLSRIVMCAERPALSAGPHLLDPCQGLESQAHSRMVGAERPAVSAGLHLLDLCLALEPQDPLILSTLLSCISALFVFLIMSPAESSTNYLPRVLDKIFSALVFTLPGETKETRSRSVKNVRRHAASLMVKIGQKYPLLLLPVFDRIKTIVNDLENKADALSKLEIICLQEALLLISNHFCEYERESVFVGEILRQVADQWLLMANEAFTTPEAFMAFVGLDKPPVEPSSNDINGRNRAQIMCATDLLSAVVKRCAWPEDPDRALRGGFVIGRTEAGNPIYRNPATPHLLPLLPGLLSLIKVFNSLWTTQAQSLLSAGYKLAHVMLEIDRNNLLGIPSSSDPMDSTRPPHTPLLRMQQFLSQVHDSCYQILGNAFPSLSRDLYQLPHLADSLIMTVLYNLECIPDYRLRPMVRVFFKPFVASCPADCYDTVVIPVLAQFTPFMFTRLNAKWQHISEQQETGSTDDENTDAQEMLEDMLNRHLTREYLDVLKLALVGGSAAELSSSPAMEDDSNELRPGHAAEVISELGLRVLNCEPTCQAVTHCLISALAWNDSNGSMKAGGLVVPVVRQLVQSGHMSTLLATHIMTMVLQGLQVHGQHETNQGSLLMLGTQLYELLRPKYPEVLEVLKQIPDVNPLDLQKLDERMLKEAQKGNKVEKAKKEMFKKITTPLHGLNIGQMFRRKASMRDLPRICQSNIKKTKTIGNGVEENDIFVKLFQVT